MMRRIHLRKMTAVLLVLALIASGGELALCDVAEEDGKIPTSGNEANTAKPPTVIAAKSVNKMFPDSLEYDFGKVKRGTLVKHTFRIVNTSGAPLKIISVRCG